MAAKLGLYVNEMKAESQHQKLSVWGEWRVILAWIMKIM